MSGSGYAVCGNSVTPYEGRIVIDKMSRWILCLAVGMLAQFGCSGTSAGGGAAGKTDSDRGATEKAAVAALHTGMIGFATIEAETPRAYEVEIVFPGEYRDFIDFSGVSESDPWYKRTAPVRVSDSIALFDSEGAIGDVPPETEFRVTFWTENDGGPHYRPTAKATLEKSSLKRPLVDKNGYCAFVIHGALSTDQPTESFSELKEQECDTTRVLLECDFDADRAPDARIVLVDYCDYLAHFLETRHSNEEIVDGGP